MDSKSTSRRSYTVPLFIILFALGAILLLIVGLVSLQSANPTRNSTEIAAQPVITVTVPAPTPTLIHSPTPVAVPPTFTSVPVATIATSTPMPAPAATPTPAPAAPDNNDEQIEAIINQLTLEQKIGQMVMVGLPGHTVDSLIYNRIVNQNVGGIILLDQNIAGPEQVRLLTADLQRVAQEDGAGIPLFIAWNEEGGNVSRRLAGMTHFPSKMALGSVNDPNLVYAVGQAVGNEMLSLGLNMNYAPVLDVNTHPANPVIGLRAFGDDPGQVSELGQQYILGIQQAGVIAVAKHFPGHGGVNVDSHFGLPRLESSLEQLQQTELPPFITAVDTNVAAIMVAHMQIPALDPSGKPASLSPSIITRLLRQTLAYDGVIMTDDIGMAAITRYTSLAQATVESVQAGNDIILTVDTATYPDIIIEAVRQAVVAGAISEAQIDASVRRILRLKLAYPLVPPAERPLLPQQAENQTLAMELGHRSVRLVQNEMGWLPLHLPNNNLVVISPLRLNPGPILHNGYTLLGEILLDEGLAVTELFYNPRSAASVRQAQTNALTHTPDAYIVVTWDAALRQAQTGDTSQEELVAALLTTGRPVIVVFGALPYDQMRLSHAPTQIMMYGDTDGQIEGVVALLLGP